MKHLVLDPDHSELTFSVKHLMLVTTSGKITDFNVEMHWDGINFSSAQFEMNAQLSSINTLNKIRDNRLKEADILNTDQFPDMRFISKSLSLLGAINQFKVEGNLTLKGQTHPVSLDMFYHGSAIDSYTGEKKQGFSFSTTIDRRDWGIDFNIPFSGEGETIGNKVKIQAELEFKIS